MTEVLNLGDIVRLRSGGPTMTVNEKAPGGGLVCVWFTGDEVKHHTFKPEALDTALPESAAEGAIAAGT